MSLSRRELLGYSTAFGPAFLAAQGLLAAAAQPSSQTQPAPPPTGKKYNMKKSINLWAFPYPQQMTLKECLQLAKNAGARVFATAGSDEKVGLCRELGADVAINYTTDDFAEIVLAETDNRGVDVVFDNVGAAVYEASLKVTAYNGRYLMMGFASDKSKVDEPFFVPRGIAAGNVKICGVLLSYADPGIATFVKQAMGFNFVAREVGERISAEVLELVRAGKVRPVIGQVVGFDQVPQAIDDLANRRTTGRVVVQLADG